MNVLKLERWMVDYMSFDQGIKLRHDFQTKSMSRQCSYFQVSYPRLDIIPMGRDGWYADRSGQCWMELNGVPYKGDYGMFKHSLRCLQDAEDTAGKHDVLKLAELERKLYGSLSERTIISVRAWEQRDFYQRVRKGFVSQRKRLLEFKKNMGKSTETSND